MSTNTKYLAETVDKLGRIKAEIADLEKREAEYKAVLIAAGISPVEGDLFRATVSTTERQTLPIKAAVAKLRELGCSHQWFTANTETRSVTVVKVVARTGVLEAEAA